MLLQSRSDSVRYFYNLGFWETGAISLAEQVNFAAPYFSETICSAKKGEESGASSFKKRALFEEHKTNAKRNQLVRSVATSDIPLIKSAIF